MTVSLDPSSTISSSISRVLVAKTDENFYLVIQANRILMLMFYHVKLSWTVSIVFVIVSNKETESTNIKSILYHSAQI